MDLGCEVLGDMVISGQKIGHFGVMLDVVTIIPPQDGFGTGAIYDEGKVVVSAWGEDINSSQEKKFEGSLTTRKKGIYYKSKYEQSLVLRIITRKLLPFLLERLSKKE
jgi:hypothetical protein